MKCPYTIDIEQYARYTYELDDEGRCVGERRKPIEKHPFGDCLKEDCAAWDGKCMYRGAVN